MHAIHMHAIHMHAHMHLHIYKVSTNIQAISYILGYILKVGYM